MPAINAYELEPGTVFSFNQGADWVTCATIIDAPEEDSQDVIVMYLPEGKTGVSALEEYRANAHDKVITDRFEFASPGTKVR